MSAEKLFFPARADFDFAVAGVDAVADHEVVGEAVLHSAAAVGGVVFGGVAVFDRAVMHDDAAPVAGAHIDACGFTASRAQ